MSSETTCDYLKTLKKLLLTFEEAVKFHVHASGRVLETGMAPVAEAQAFVDKARAALETHIVASEKIRERAFDSSYFKDAIGDSYSPVKYGKYEAVNVITVRNVMALAKEKAPEICDVIASLIFRQCISTEREKFIVQGANERADRAEKECDELRQKLKSFETSAAACQ